MSPRTRPRPFLPRPLCLWRFLLVWCVLAPVFVAVFYIVVVVHRQRPRFGAAALQFTIGYVFLAWIVEMAYVWWKDYQALATDDDHCGIGTKLVRLGAVAGGGLCVLTVVTWAMGAWASRLPPLPTPDPVAAPPEPFDPFDESPTGVGTIPSATRFPGLLAYWAFDDSGTDAGPSRQTARVAGGKRVPGARNSAVWLGGPEKYVDLGTHPALNVAAGAPFTVAVWVRTTTDGVVLSFRNAAEPGAVVMLSVEGGRLVFRVRADRDEGRPVVVTGPPAADGRWHHAAGIRSADGALELFVDGAPVGGATGGTAGPITTDLRFVGREDYRIRANAPGLSSWAGVADELAVFGRRLSADEIGALAGRR